MNFLGLPFAPSVKAQIETRQKALGQYNNIDEKYLRSYTTKTPFVRLASSVNVTDKGSNNAPLKVSVYQKLINQGLTAEQISGDKLAKNFILQGGVVSSTGKDSYSGLQKGLNDTKSPFNGAYGWGGISERGYVPMPGITNADITFYNNGALSKTTINIKCFSKAQFQLLDVLYLRPGYTLLLEFGWSQYLNNNNELVSMDQFYTGPMSALLNGDVSQYDLYEKIDAEKKKHDYNYDAVFGKITKFNWQFNPDGSYDCQVNLTSVGDVIESLKMNISNPNKDKSSEGEEEEDENPNPPLIANKFKSLLNTELVNIYDQASQGVVDGKPTLLDYGVDSLYDSTGVKKTPLYENALLAIPVEATDEENNLTPQVYMKYGALIAFIQSKLLLYNKKTKTPIVTFDMNLDDLTKDENVILTFPGQFSGNPKVCLIPYSNCAEPAISIPSTDLNEILKKISYPYSKSKTYLGTLANMMINTEYIESTFSSQPQDDEGDIKLIDFLKSLNKGMIEALGGVNKFDCRLSQDGIKIQFIEEIPQRFEQESKLEFTRFNVFGVKPGVDGSFIRNINLTADLSNDFATMISIGAQANSNQISGNATSFSNYSAGLKDRIIEEKVSSPANTDTGGKEATPQEEALENFTTNIYSETDENIRLFSNVYNDLKFIDENVTSLTAHNQTHAKLLLGILTDATAAEAAQLDAPFFLPFNLSLEMDGISGIKLYQKFLITNDILPPSYQDDNVDLQVTGVNHNIDGSAWMTKLDTLSVPRNKSKGAVKRPTEQKSLVTTQNYVSGTSKPLPPLSVVEPPESSNPEAIERFNAMQNAYNAVFQRDGAVSGMCAQWTYNLARAYTKFLSSEQADIGSKLAAGGNANQNNEFFNNLTKLGYTQTKSTGLSRKKCIDTVANTTWGYGDVVVYYANDKPTAGSNSHYVYGHAQIYVGNINSSGWSTSTQTNYDTDMVYKGRKSDNWDILIFRAPETA